MKPISYIGRFAPSPTGPLHLGSLVTALASYLDAKAHHGQWLVRIEDIDFSRNVKDVDELILQQLQHYGMIWDQTVVYQSQRLTDYQSILNDLISQQRVYPCICSRQQVFARHPQGIYQGTCRQQAIPAHTKQQAWRLKVETIQGSQENQDISTQQCFTNHTLIDSETLCQDVKEDVGDFVLKRMDGYWAYQFAVVVDDAWQGITHIVRGSDLLDNTPRQLYLQKVLAYPTPHYRHIPLVYNHLGQKLSKQTRAQSISVHHQEDILSTLKLAAQHLGLNIHAVTMTEFFERAIEAWANLANALSRV